MARTDKERFDEAIRYIIRYIGADLALSATGALTQRTDADVGAAISLGGAGYWRHGSEDQHTAVRALLLCQQAFLMAPFAVGAGGAPFNYIVFPDLAKTYYLKKTEEQVKQALRAYLPIGGAARDDVVTAATGIQNPGGGTYWETMRRDTDPFPGMPVCFDALKMWLFKAGFVSLRWLAQTGPLMTAQTVNAMLGQGVVIQEAQLGNMPAGYLFNFHRAGDQAVCHWGVSLGAGWAAGSNTTANWPGAAAPVNFRSGGGAYGEFTLASALEVCKHKYKRPPEAVADVTIRQIDPTLVATYF